MSHKVQSFTSRQHMIRSTYEIYHYRDSRMDEVALHHHDFYEVYLLLGGNAEYIIENRTYRVTPGDVLFINPNELHQPILRPEEGDYERLVLWIDKNYLDQFASLGTDLKHCFRLAQANHTNLIRVEPGKLELLITLLEHARMELESTEFGSEIVSDTVLIQALVLLNRMALKGGIVPQLRDKSDSLVSRVLAFINEHYAEEISLDDLANRFFVSKYHLSREFSRLTGVSVYRYIIQKRLIMAKELLSRGGSSTEVYQSCGFGDYSNFYRAFRSEYGVSPREYVAKLKTDMALNAARAKERAALMNPLTGEE